MTTKNLERRVSMSKVGCGTYRITTKYYGRNITTTTNDSPLYDRYTEGWDGENRPFGMTWHQCLQRAHNICVRDNKEYPVYYAI